MTKKFDRSSFKAAKLESNKAAANEMEKTFQSNSKTREDYHTLQDGNNFIRIMPPHNENESSIQPKVVYWLDVLVEEKNEDGTSKGTSKWLSRPIFDSRIHGGTKKDIVDEFIRFARKKVAQEIQDKEEQKKVLYPITGWRDKSQNGKPGKWNRGILANQSYVCYATLNGITPANLKRLELWKQDKDMLEMLNISEDPSEVITTDIFSDPDNGCEFNLCLGYDDKGNRTRVITKRTFTIPSVGGVKVKGQALAQAAEEFEESQKVPDEVLEKLSTLEPLEKMFKNVYKRRDFERALEALEHFDDEKLKLGIFEDSEWDDIVKEISKYYPETNDSAEDAELKKTFEKGRKKTAVKKEEREAVEEVVDGIMDFSEMTRSELKAFIIEHELDITVNSRISDEQLKEMVEEEWELKQGGSKEDSLGNVEDENDEENEDPDPVADDEEGDLPWEKENKKETDKMITPSKRPATNASSIRDRTRARLAERNGGKK